MTEQPFSGQLCSPLIREGPRKGGPNIACPIYLASKLREDTARPERRTALTAKELARYNIDIAALSETRLPDEGSLTELTSGYTFFWKGHAQTEDKIHRVGLAIKTTLLKNLPDLPVGINERLMKIRLPLNEKWYATVISAYAPTITSADETIADNCTS
ncbi:hypothetical protein QQF64_016733 [Cirrhinus molitorella]|uniref:Uncharacterized protein n=1 Tax=Cirrhinus molitorella TaxID=172907 RepID=A0ABR3LS38_9TELE